jgi:DNA-binding SARP family transcriptional activator
MKYSYSEIAVPEDIHSQEYEQEADYRAYFFGPFRVLHDGQPLGENGQRREKAALVLRWLLLNPGRPLAADELLEQFWPGQEPAKAMVKFHVTMHCMRRMLEPELPARQESSFIRRGPGNFYRFDPAGQWWTDAAEVERLLSRAHACDAHGDRHRASFYYRQVARYCSMGFLAGEPDVAGMNGYRRRIQEIHSVVLMRLLHLEGDSVPREELLDYAYHLLRIDQCNEVANRLIIDAYLDSGNTARAARRLDRYCDSLTRELGLQPSHDLIRLRERIGSGGRAGRYRPGSSAGRN